LQNFLATKQGLGRIKNSFIVVLRKIKIKGIFYTCLTKQLSVFSRQLFPSSTSTKQTLREVLCGRSNKKKAAIAKITT
jgi:hypothetical protein